MSVIFHLPWQDILVFFLGWKTGSVFRSRRRNSIDKRGS